MKPITITLTLDLEQRSLLDQAIHDSVAMALVDKSRNENWIQNGMAERLGRLDQAKANIQKAETKIKALRALLHHIEESIFETLKQQGAEEARNIMKEETTV